MYRLAIFDFDGTLADSARWMRGALNDVARLYRFNVLEDHEFEELRGKDTRAVLQHLGVATWKLPFVARHMRRLVARDAHLIAPFPGVQDLLRDLHERGVLLAIVTSNAEENVRAILGPRTASRIRYYACGAGLFGKRAKFREVLRRSGIAPERAIAIGDETRDIAAAVAERIHAGSVTWGYATADLLRAHRPTEVFDTVEELRRVLLPPRA